MGHARGKGRGQASDVVEPPAPAPALAVVYNSWTEVTPPEEERSSLLGEDEGTDTSWLDADFQRRLRKSKPYGSDANDALDAWIDELPRIYPNDPAYAAKAAEFHAIAARRRLGMSDTAPVEDVPTPFIDPPPPPPAPDEPVADVCEPPEGSEGDNLQAAVQVADVTSPAHPWDKNDEGTKLGTLDPVKKVPRMNTIMRGEADTLDTLICSEFTAAALVEAGWKLEENYRDPATRLEVAYTEPAGAIHFVRLFDIVQMMSGAIKAALDAQHRVCERIEPGTPEAANLNASHHPRTFLYSGAEGTFVGMEHRATDEFGAGLAAHAVGGVAVDIQDRRPGDVQQAMVDQKTEIYGDHGHSSTVYSVNGYGIAYLGGSGSPTVLNLDTSKLEAGWYEIEAGQKGLAWQLNADTDPKRVADFTIQSVKLIDSNTGRRGANGERDSTGLGPETPKAFLSTGRLPTSPWLGWKPSDVDGVRPLKAPSAD